MRGQAVREHPARGRGSREEQPERGDPERADRVTARVDGEQEPPIRAQRELALRVEDRAHRRAARLLLLAALTARSDGLTLLERPIPAAAEDDDLVVGRIVGLGEHRSDEPTVLVGPPGSIVRRGGRRRPRHGRDGQRDHRPRACREMRFPERHREYPLVGCSRRDPPTRTVPAGASRTLPPVRLGRVTIRDSSATARLPRGHAKRRLAGERCACAFATVAWGRCAARLGADSLRFPAHALPVMTPHSRARHGPIFVRGAYPVWSGRTTRAPLDSEHRANIVS